jgi:catechol 2,3-dioxygenase-like lactoylglutathione lyase family enzyme
MADQTAPAVRPQPMIAVADLAASSRWYQRVLGASSGHGDAEYEQLLVGGWLVLQLHRREIGHHHGTIADPGQPVGNGLALWFETADFDTVVGRIRALAARVETDVHVNPNAGHREIWIRDLDGYLVVFAEPYQSPVSGRTPDR